MIVRVSRDFSISGQGQWNEHLIIMQEGESSSCEVWYILEDCLPLGSGKRSIQRCARVCIDGGHQIIRGFLAVVTSLELSYRQPPNPFQLAGKREVYFVIMAVELG